MLAQGLVTAFREKPAASTFRFASLGIYLFRRDFLLDVLGPGRVDIVFDIIMPWIESGQVAGFPFEGYWEDIGSIESYYRASMQLLKRRSLIADPRWPIFTRGEDLPPARCAEGSRITDSIIADGCVVKGEVRGSILFPGVTIERGALLEDSIAFSFARVGPNAEVKRAILDKFVEVGSGARVGVSSLRRNAMRGTTAARGSSERGAGIAVIGRSACVSPAARLSAGSVIEPHTRVGGKR